MPDASPPPPPATPSPQRATTPSTPLPTPDVDRHPAVDPAALPRARALRRRAAAAVLPPRRERPAGRPGDAVVLVGAIGRGGAAVLATACGPWLGARLPAADLAAARRWADDGGWDVEAVAARIDDALAAQAAAADGGIDPLAGTAVRAAAGALLALGDGGLARAALRLAAASAATVALDAGAVPLHAATARLCDRLGLNPLDLQSAGSVLFTAPPAPARAAVARLAAGGDVAAVVGSIVAGPPAAVLVMGGSRRPLPPAADDAVDVVLGRPARRRGRSTD